LIPKWLGLPDLEDNVCEGTIIKPKAVKFFGNGSRVILKNKNEKWSEVEKRDKPRNPEKETVLSESGQEVFTTLMRYVTANRLNNVLSKEGGFSPKIMGKVIGMMAQDTLADFVKDQGSILENLEKTEQKIITKRLQNAVIKLIKAECMTLK
jgi:Rnl2 family RNA ligase